jgi:hypothetical protein
MGTSSMDDTAGSAFSTVTVGSMRLADKWVCDSCASHHLISNRQYFVTHKGFSAPVNISLAGKGTILPCGFGRVNIEMLVDEVVHRLLGTLVVRSRYWKTPVPGTECDTIWNWSHHKTTTYYVLTRWSARGNRRVDDGRIRHGHARCVPKTASGS